MKSKTYDEYIEKFKTKKKSPDDTFTPAAVYDAVAGYVASAYGLDRSQFVRPFWPGADYKVYDYKPDSVVVDNPPFSVLAKIITYYQVHGIPFFLFAPTLSIPYCIHNKAGVCGIVCKVSLVYDNGATVSTSFVTNLEPDKRTIIRTAPELQEALVQANELTLAEQGKKTLPRYDYPSGVLTAAMVARIAEAGIPYSLSADDVAFVSALDSQKPTGKAIYGGGYLLSDKARTVKEKAEAKAEKARQDKDRIVWDLSEREKEIIASLK